MDPVSNEISGLSQSISRTVDTLEEKDANGSQPLEYCDQDDYQETEEQHLTSSKQKVFCDSKPTFESLEFDDIDELNIEDISKLTMNKSTQTCVNELSRNAGKTADRRRDVPGYQHN